MQKNRYWLSDRGLEMDAGAYVAMLEYAADTKAMIIGKPTKPFFDMALKDLNVAAENVLMIGDDIETDVLGAQKLGMQTAFVETGKFMIKDLEKNQVKPDFVLKSISEIDQIIDLN